MRQLLTPCSIALTIWDVTRLYTSCFSVAVFSFVDIVKIVLSRCLGIGRCLRTCRFRFLHRQSKSNSKSNQERWGYLQLPQTDRGAGRFNAGWGDVSVGVR